MESRELENAKKYILFFIKMFECNYVHHKEINISDPLTQRQI